MHILCLSLKIVLFCGALASAILKFEMTNYGLNFIAMHLSKYFGGFSIDVEELSHTVFLYFYLSLCKYDSKLDYFITKMFLNMIKIAKQCYFFKFLSLKLQHLIYFYF